MTEQLHNYSSIHFFCDAPILLSLPIPSYPSLYYYTTILVIRNKESKHYRCNNVTVRHFLKSECGGFPVD